MELAASTGTMGLTASTGTLPTDGTNNLDKLSLFNGNGSDTGLSGSNLNTSGDTMDEITTA